MENLNNFVSLSLNYKNGLNEKQAQKQTKNFISFSPSPSPSLSLFNLFVIFKLKKQKKMNKKRVEENPWEMSFDMIVERERKYENKKEKCIAIDKKTMFVRAINPSLLHCIEPCQFWPVAWEWGREQKKMREKKESERKKLLFTSGSSISPVWDTIANNITNTTTSTTSAHDLLHRQLCTQPRERERESHIAKYIILCSPKGSEPYETMMTIDWLAIKSTFAILDKLFFYSLSVLFSSSFFSPPPPDRPPVCIGIVILPSLFSSLSLHLSVYDLTVSQSRNVCAYIYFNSNQKNKNYISFHSICVASSITRGENRKRERGREGEPTNIIENIYLTSSLQCPHVLDRYEK